MFKKFAQVPILALAEAEYTNDKLAFKRVAQTKEESVYQTNPNKINVKAILEMVADEYDISSDPKDYIFEAVRAVTTGVPNENGDEFGKGELLRFDHRLAKAVYQTFIPKPHHINHRADNPKTSRGVVLDASYNDSAPPLDECPECQHKTAAPDGRDKCGVHCGKCGYPVKDEFVELLLAVDTRKDKTFAEAVRLGSLDSLSMGCTAEYTDCSICENRARSVSQFCSHIKSGNKKKMFKTASGMKMSYERCGGVIFTEISRVDQPADPKAKSREVFSLSQGTPLGIESEMLVMSSKIAKLEQMVRKSESSDISIERAIEILEKDRKTSHGTADSIAVNSAHKILSQIKSAQLNTLSDPQVPFKTIAESIKWAESSIHKLKGEVTRLAAEKDQKHKDAAASGKPMYAWENASYTAQIKANNQYISRLEDYIGKARSLEASGGPWGRSLTRSMSRFFATKVAQEAAGDIDKILEQLEPLKEIHPEIYNLLMQELAPEDSDVPEPVSIDDYTEEYEERGDQSISPGEMGIKVEEGGVGLPPLVSNMEQNISNDLDALLDSVKESTVDVNTSALKFAHAYKNIEAITTNSGNVKVFNPHGTLFIVRPDTKPVGKDQALKLNKDILAYIAEHGLVGAMDHYKPILGPKLSQVLQHHVEDFEDGREEGDKGPITEGDDDDMDGDARGTPPKSLVNEESNDMQDGHDKRDMGDDVLEKHQPDHEEALPAGYTPATEEEYSDRAEDRAKKPKTTLDNVTVDYEDKKPKGSSMKEAVKTAEMPDFLKKKLNKDDGDGADSDKEADKDKGPKKKDPNRPVNPQEQNAKGKGDKDKGDAKKGQMAPPMAPPGAPMGAGDQPGPGAQQAAGSMTGCSDMCAKATGKVAGPCECPPECECLDCGCDCAMDKMGQGMGAPMGAPAAPPPQAPAGGGMMASKQAAAQKYVSRMERLYKNRMKQVAEVAAVKVAEAEKTAAEKVTAKFLRALKLAAKRQALNIEYSPLKAAMCDVLTSKLDIDTDTYYPGMDTITAASLVEATSAAGFDAFVDSILKRAADFAKMKEETLVEIENDIKHLRAAPIQVVNNDTPDDSVKGERRQAALNGNMPIAPSPIKETISNVGNRSNIRSALGSTKVRRAGKSLLKR